MAQLYAKKSSDGQPKALECSDEGLLKVDPDLWDIGSSVRITNDGTSKSVSIPAEARAFVCMAEGGPCRCEIDAAAGADSTIYVAEDASLTYPILGSEQTLACYGVAGSYGNFRFLG